MKRRRHSRKSGLPPASPVYTGSGTGNTIINMLVFNDENFKHHKNISVEDAINLQGKETTNWILVKGFSQVEALKKLADSFKIHPLVIEDIFNVDHQPKVEDFGTSLFVTLKNLIWVDSVQLVEYEQVSLFLGPNVLISFEENDTNIFDPIIERLKAGKGKGRLRQEDYLCYLLIDHIVDNYYLLLDHTEDQIEKLEELLNGIPALSYHIYS